MFKKFALGTACALLFASPAVAANQSAKNLSPVNITPAQALAAKHVLAHNSKMTVPHKQAVSSRSKHKIAMNRSMFGNREVSSLNVLEAAGYRDFKDLHAQGRNIAVEADKAGKSYDVLVLPSGAIRATKA